MTAIVDLIQNLALLVALSVVASMLGRHPIPKVPPFLVQGFLLGAVAVAGMLNAMSLGEGIQFDGRSVALSLCGLYFGPWAALAASVMAGACRLWQGGVGVPMGLAGICFSTVIGIVAHHRCHGKPAGHSNLELWLFGTVVHLAVLGTTLFWPGGLGFEMFPRTAPTLLVAFPLATVLVGRILAGEEGRRRFVDQIRESEALFRATLYSIGDGVITTDQNGRIQQMNPVAEELTGWSESEAQGSPLQEIFKIVQEGTGLPAENPALRALKEGKIIGLANHTLLIARDGRERPIADSGAPIRSADGSIIGVVLVFRDQSAERGAERARRTSDERFVRALEHIPDVVVIYDTDLRIQYINEATRRVSGRPASDFLGKRDDEVWPLNICVPYLPTLRAALTTGEPQNLDLKLFLPESGTRNLNIRCVPVLDEDGQVHEVLGITHDYTEENRSAEALREGEVRFRTVFNQQFQFMAILSPEGRVLEINDLPLRAGDLTREAVLGKLFWETPWWRDLPSMRLNWPKRLQAAGMTDNPVLSIDEYQTASGEVRVAEASVTTVKDASGAPQYFIIQATDITEQQRSREELVAAKNLLERTLDSLSEAVLVIDYDTRSIIRCNLAVEKIFGYTPAELDRKGTMVLHLDPGYYTRFGVDSEVVLARGESYRVEYPMRRKDGSVLIAEITVSAIGGPLAWKSGVVSVIRDITNRKEAEDALRKSESLLRIAGEAAHIGGWFMDLPDGRLIWSEEVRAIHGYERERFPSVDEALTHYTSESREALSDALCECMANGVPFDVELELIPGDGRQVWERAIGQAVRDESGKIVRIQGALQDISERKRFESSLVRSQQQFQHIADALPLIVWTSGADGAVDFVNQAFVSYTGFGLDGGVENPWLDAVHPEDLVRCIETWAVASDSASAYSSEFRIRRHDGQYRWHQVQGLPVKNDDGAVTRWYGTASDVHDSKMNEERLARTLESITDALYTLDRNWRFTYVNQEAERLLRRSREELLGQVAGRVFPDILGTEVDRHYARAIHENCTVEFETFYEPLGRWFEIHAYPSEEGLAVYFRDITERIKAEQELRDLSARLQGILDFSPLLISELDLEGRYLIANDAVCRFLGQEPGTLVGKYISDLIPGPLVDLFMSRIRKVQQDGKPLVVEDSFEDGETTPHFSTMLFPLFDEEGKVTSVGGIAQEVTDRKRAEVEREKLEAQLRQVQKMDAIGRLAGGVAHDFNNMLGVILGFTDMAMEALPDDHPATRDLREVHVAASHSANLTRQLLAFARKQTITLEVLDLNQSVSSILKMLGRLIGEDIELVWKPGAEIGLVRLDRTQIDQLLANLAVNARDAIQGVGRLVIETARVELDAEYCEQNPGFIPGHYVSLTVSDNGCGMTRETQAQIFEPFFTTKPLGSGTGLGLSTVYGIVKQNSGFVHVYSEPGKGTTFRIYLPSHAEPGEVAGSVPKEVVRPRGTETVLLVEDESGLLELGRRLLDRLGYVVITANGPRQALAAAVDYPGTIDLLLTDVIMPDMNGRDLWLQLKALRPGLKSLFMSGYTADVIAHHGALEEGVHFLQKPFTMDGLATKIREALHDRDEVRGG